STTTAVTPGVSPCATAAWSRSLSARALRPFDLATGEAGLKVPTPTSTMISAAKVPKAIDLVFMVSAGILMQFDVMSYEVGFRLWGSGFGHGLWALSCAC